MLYLVLFVLGVVVVFLFRRWVVFLYDGVLVFGNVFLFVEVGVCFWVVVVDVVGFVLGVGECGEFEGGEDGGGLDEEVEVWRGCGWEVEFGVVFVDGVFDFFGGGGEIEGVDFGEELVDFEVDEGW